jgi:hypothetical protein
MVSKQILDLMRLNEKVMNMNNKQYGFANLTGGDLQQVHNLEKQLSKEKGEEVILIAYHDQKENQGK